ncbi:hypothetical protein MKK50_15180 [Methylobacterium sp. J-043]|nr:hypothetical protein [Methylobacterium sp. J-043]
MNLLELRTALADYTARSDLPITTLISLAESKFASSVKHRLGERQVEIAVAKSARSFPLPADFREARSIKLDGRPLTLASIDDLDNAPGCTDRYAIVGTDVHLQSRPAESAKIALTYYARVPALTEAAPSNWLSATFPDVYLYAALVEYAIWAQDKEKQASYAALLGVALGNLSADHTRSAFSGSTLQTRRF